MFGWRKNCDPVNVGKIYFTAYLDTSTEVRHGAITGTVDIDGVDEPIHKFHSMLKKWNDTGFARFGDEYVPVRRVTRVIINKTEDHYEVGG